MLKIFSRIPNRDIYISTNSPLGQYSNSKIEIEEIREEKNPYTNTKKQSLLLMIL